MPSLPGSLALTTVQTSAQILSADHRNNYAAIQTAVNGLITALSSGSSGQVLKALSGSSVDWSGGTFGTYTPAWSSSGVAPALGNGTLTGRSTQIGKQVTGTVFLTIGSTTTLGTGNYFFTLPANSQEGANLAPVGTALVRQAASGNVYPQFPLNFDAANKMLLVSPASPGAVLTGAVPIALVTGDQVLINFSYEAA